MDDEPMNRHQKQLTVLVGTFDLICKLLARLPVPIGIADLDDGGDPTNAIQSLERARVTLVSDQPLSDQQKDLLKSVILHWLTAYETAGLIKFIGLAEWRLDAMDHALRRAITLALPVAADLGVDIEPE